MLYSLSSLYFCSLYYLFFFSYRCRYNSLKCCPAIVEVSTVGRSQNVLIIHSEGRQHFSAVPNAPGQNDLRRKGTKNTIQAKFK